MTTKPEAMSAEIEVGLPFEITPEDVAASEAAYGTSSGGYAFARTEYQRQRSRTRQLLKTLRDNKAAEQDAKMWKCMVEDSAEHQLAVSEGALHARQGKPMNPSYSASGKLNYTYQSAYEDTQSRMEAEASLAAANQRAGEAFNANREKDAEIERLKEQLSEVCWVYQCDQCRYAGNPEDLGKKCRFCSGVCIRFSTSVESERRAVRDSNRINELASEKKAQWESLYKSVRYEYARAEKAGSPAE